MSVQLPILDDEAQLGQSLAAQWLVLSPGANVLGLLTTGGIELVFGR